MVSVQFQSLTSLESLPACGVEVFDVSANRLTSLSGIEQLPKLTALTADGTQQGETPRDEAKMMTPEEVARIVARGILKRKRLCLMENEGRATHFVKKFAPGFLDRMFYLVMSREPDSPLK